MRDHVYHPHESAEDLVEAYGAHFAEEGLPASLLQKVKSQRMWAFVEISNDPSTLSVVHFWHAPDADVALVVKMIGHELGHISGVGPIANPGDPLEETRAHEFGLVATEVIVLLAARGLISGPGLPEGALRALRPRAPRRRAASGKRTGRKSRKRAPRARPR